MPGNTKFPATGLDSHSGGDPYGFQEVFNFLATTVNGTVNTGDGTIPVASTTGFPTRGLISIDTEVIAYTAKTATTFTGCTRGYDGTVAASHTNGATVASVPSAAHHNDLAAAIVALETKLGVLSSTPVARAILSGGANAGESQWLQQLLLGVQATPAAPGSGAGLLYPDADGVWRALNGASAVPSVIGPADPPLLVDGGMEVWQRGTSLAVPASTTDLTGYTVDHWCLRTGANQACHVNRVAGLTNDSQYAAQIIRDSGQTGTGTLVFEQPYKTVDVVKFRGRPVSVRFDARAGASYSPTTGNLTVAVRCGTGAEGRRGAGFTGETVLVSSTVQLTTTPTGYSGVGTVTVPTNATQMSVAFEMTPVGTASTDDSFHVDNVTLASGSIPQPYRPLAYGADLAACLHYHWTIAAGGATAFIAQGQANTTQAALLLAPLPAPMRIKPSFLPGPTLASFGLSGPSGTGLSPLTTFSIHASSSPYTALLSTTVGSGLTVGQITQLYFGNTSATLDLDAEL